MKIELSRREFAGAAGWVARTLEDKPYDPVLAGILLETHHTDGDMLRVSAHNRETSARTDIPATVTEPGRVLVSGNLLAAVTKVLPDKPVELAVVGTEVDITCGGGHFTLPTLPVEDFPTLPDLPDLLGQVPATEFIRAVTQVAPAASTGDDLPRFCGVFMEITDGVLGLIATDRFRLAIRELDWQPAMTTLDWNGEGLLIPARLLMDFAKGMDPTSTIRLAATPGGTVLGVSDGTRHATTSLIDPAGLTGVGFRTVIPTGHTASATLPMAPLVEVVKRVSAVAAADRSCPDRHLQLTFTPTQLQVATTPGQGHSNAHDTLPATVTGTTPAAITLKPTLLLPTLTALDHPHLRIDLAGPRRPIQLRPATPDGDPIDGHTHAIALMRPPDTHISTQAAA